MTHPPGPRLPMVRTDASPPAPRPSMGSGAPRLRWPCVVNLPAIATEGGGLRGRFRASYDVARAVWREHSSLRRSLLGWAGLSLILMGVASHFLGAAARPETALVALAIQVGWAALWLTIAGLHLGTVRGDDGVRRPGLGVPNGLTLLRILLVPATCWAILAHPRLLPHGGLVAALIFVVGFTDVLDGWLARLLRYQTVLGRYFDHVADVLICSALALAEHWAGLMPLWLTGLYLLRYLGAWVAGTYGLATRPGLRIAPSWIGRIGTLVAGSTLFLTIAQPLLAPGLAVGVLHIGTGVVIGVNMIALVVMTFRGTAFELIDPTSGELPPDDPSPDDPSPADPSPGDLSAGDPSPGDPTQEGVSPRKET